MALLAFSSGNENDLFSKGAFSKGVDNPGKRGKKVILNFLRKMGLHTSPHENESKHLSEDLMNLHP